MSRSTNIFVVISGDTPLVGFTVKHELVTWLKGLGRIDLLTLKGFRVFRVRDGVSLGLKDSVELDINELLK